MIYLHFVIMISLILTNFSKSLGFGNDYRLIHSLCPRIVLTTQNAYNTHVKCNINNQMTMMSDKNKAINSNSGKNDKSRDYYSQKGSQPRQSTPKSSASRSAAFSPSNRPKRSYSTASKSSDSEASDSVRINKCLLSLSRRGADDAVNEGRVTINGSQAKIGDRVKIGDIVRLDGKIQRWESVAIAKQSRPSKTLEDRDFVYLKYWKPPDVTCTSDLSDKSNIITKGNFQLFPQRLFTVGRLDKDSTGLILLTSDGRVNNAILSPSMSKEKVRRN